MNYYGLLEMKLQKIKNLGLTLKQQDFSYIFKFLFFDPKKTYWVSLNKIFKNLFIFLFFFFENI